MRHLIVLCTLIVSIPFLAVGCDDGGEGSPTATPSTTTAATQTATRATPTFAASPTPSPMSTPTIVASPTRPAATATPAPYAMIVRSGVTSRRAIALTFDAGSDAGNTRAILTTLREKGVRATFSITGLWAEKYPAELLAITTEGHPLMNHSYSHRSFTGASTGAPALTTEERVLEMQRTETTVYRMSNRSTRPYFRPPYGDIDAALPADVALGGYGFIVMWSIDTLGWNGASADEIVARVRAQAAPGAIVVLHVGTSSQDAAALPAIIDALRADGYTFETIDEILTP